MSALLDFNGEYEKENKLNFHYREKAEYMEIIVVSGYLFKRQ